ncbi:AAA family ATPase [Mycobacterium sp. 1274756.6]|uniref:AAA family ATPase n=1 Tax=Mycobacterium sp. 1274756.6 TaxID=1834076 RepID=UPI000AECA6ED|nr:AAA family ATPase [Mycobacterium sp. 1274756.6]
MSTARKNLELEDERTTQKRYTNALREKSKRSSAYQGPRNSLWTGAGVPTRREVKSGELAGRVALVGPDEWVLEGQSDFYIGEHHAELDGIQVFSWTAPIACTFFRGNDHHKLCDDVAVIRTFVHRNGRLIDLSDEVVRSDAPDRPFAKRGLTIPAPPSMPKPPVRDVPKPTPPAADAPADQEHDHDHGPSGIRAEEALRAQLQAPRTKGLSSVLATLQPDQYDLVTVAARDNMIIEGKPGTGKTIIAAHRAAYLVNDETPAEKKLKGNLLLIGPTPGYSKHVIDVINRLAPGSNQIRVLSLPELWQHILGLDFQPVGDISSTSRDVDWKLVRFLRTAIRRVRTSNGGAALSPEQVYEYMRANSAAIARDPEWSEYLSGLPEYKHALMMRAHSPLLAYIQWEVNPPTDLAGITHIVIDEAQDVTPLGWLLLDEINVADTWTVLGDLNQRRSDHTPTNWPEILDLIAIAEDTPVRQLAIGYRSTRPILEFATRLLPPGERAITAFQQDGPAPTVEKVRPAELGNAIADQVERLLTAYPLGTVAVIGPDTGVARRTLRARGWVGSMHDPSPWERDGREVTVLDPDSARGIEFDAVVVVEPAAFRQNRGHQGPLYTALTRANRELVVVHSRALPEPLRRRS